MQTTSAIVEGQPATPVAEAGQFQAGHVLTVSAGHAVHDTYTAFLPSLLPVFIANLSLSNTEAGLLTVFMQGPSLVQPLIGHLADRIGGGKPFAGKWPVEDRGVSVEDVREVQFLLSQLGFDTKGIDGMRGPNTMRAARAFQQARGLVPDGYLSAALLEALRGAIRERG